MKTFVVSKHHPKKTKGKRSRNLLISAAIMASGAAACKSGSKGGDNHSAVASSNDTTKVLDSQVASYDATRASYPVHQRI